LESTSELKDKDRAAIAALPLRTRTVIEKRDILREGAKPNEACLILSGLAARYKVVVGGRRQILSLHLPGDMPDLQALYVPALDHSLVALTPVRVGYIPHESLRNLMRLNAAVADALMRQMVIEAAIYREWIASIGRRTALERTAHLICETFMRMNAIGLAEQATFDFALTQVEIADATGLSSVHVNRTLKELRRLGLIETSGKVHALSDWEKIQETADFDPAYLQLRRPVLR
jgi:CRP-like cAMP-binding protein